MSITSTAWRRRPSPDIVGHMPIATASRHTIPGQVQALTSSCPGGEHVVRGSCPGREPRSRSTFTVQFMAFGGSRTRVSHKFSPGWDKTVVIQWIGNLGMSSIVILSRLRDMVSLCSFVCVSRSSLLARSRAKPRMGQYLSALPFFDLGVGYVPYPSYPRGCNIMMSTSEYAQYTVYIWRYS